MANNDAKRLYIYVPGLGGHRLLNAQRFFIWFWRSTNREIMFLEPRWHYKNEDYKTKKERLSFEIKNKLEQQDYQVCIVGSSAGGSLALNLFKELRLDGMVTIAGKLKRPGLIGRKYRARAPALYDCVVESSNNIKGFGIKTKFKILTLSPYLDFTVYKRDNRILGADNRRIGTISHALGIIWAISVDKYRIFSWFDSMSSPSTDKKA